VTATVSFLLQSDTPVTPVVKTLSLPPHSRTTLDAGTVAGVVGRSFGISVDGNLPIVAERATYFGTTPLRLWEGGDGSPGATERSQSWLFAEGATGTFFDTFFVIANFDTVAHDVTFTFLRDDGVTITKVKTVGPQSRYTMPVDTEDPGLANATFSTTITGGPGIVAEREMYWSSAGPWVDSHSVFGVNAPGLKWGFAEGRAGTGGGLDFHSYILIGNPSTTPADVKVTYLRNSRPPIAKAYVVPPTSRFTVDVSETAGLPNESFGAIVETTNGVPIFVERSMYWSPGGTIFGGGLATTGTRLP
jgi:hypothetical protein